MGAGSARSGTAMKVCEMMLRLFMFFFTLSTLETICKHTNAKATERVYKTKHTRADGRTYYKVCVTDSLTYTRAHIHAYSHNHSLIVNVFLGVPSKSVQKIGVY